MRPRCTAPARRRLLPLLLALAMLAAVPGATAVGGFSQLTAERLWDLVRVRDFAVSPDGSQVVFTLAAFPRGSALPAVDLWLVDSDGRQQPRRLTRSPGADLDPAWSPDGGRIAYTYATPGAPATTLYVLDLRGGEPTPVLEWPTPARRPRFEADGQALVFEGETYADVDGNVERLRQRLAGETEREAVAFATESRFARRAGRPVDPARVRHVLRLELESGKLVDLTPGLSTTSVLAPFEWDLSPDGRLLALTALVDGRPHVSRDRDIVLLDLVDGEGTNLTGERSGSAFDPRFVDGRHLLFGEHLRKDALGENTVLKLASLDDGEIRAVTDPARLSPERWRADADDGLVYFLAEADGARHVFRTGLRDGQVRRVVEGGNVSALELAGTDELVFVADSLSRPPALYRSRRDGRRREPLTAFNRVLLEDTRLGRAGRIAFQGFEERTVEALVVHPPGFDAGRRWPVLLAIHGGPHDAWRDEFHPRWNLMLLAAPGYVVVAPNVHGSTGYGQAFAERILGDPVGPPAEDLRRLRAWLERQPWVDRHRLGLVGGSYGGYLANWVLTREAGYATGVIHAGIFELTVQYASDHPWGRHRTYGALPWQDPARYRALSPSTYAEEIRTPVLLLHGERDTRVPTVHSLMQHNLLTALGVPSRLVLFPESGHRIDDRIAAERWWAEVFSWLARTLPPGPATASPVGRPSPPPSPVPVARGGAQQTVR